MVQPGFGGITMAFDLDAKLRNNFVVYLMLTILVIIMVGTFLIAYGATEHYRELITSFDIVPVISSNQITG
jgi:hypothetical protein